MRALSRFRGPILALATLLALGACDTPAERAEVHYQRALTLLAEGDEARAMIEFRNVFRLDGTHEAARLRYAELLRARGETNEALSQLLRLVEQDPKNLAGQRTLIEVAVEAGDLDTAALHVTEAYALAPTDPMIRALKATIDYRKGDDRPAAVALAEAVVAEAPDNVMAQMVLIADRLQAGDPAGALTRIDAALVHAPKDEGLHLARLTAFEALEDDAALGDELRQMVTLFPDNAGMRAALVQWHLGHGDADAAEAVLRTGLTETAPPPTDPDADGGSKPGADPARALTLVRFLNDIRGPEAARGELDQLVATMADPAPFERARAALDFAEGNTTAAIAAMRGLLEGATPSEATRDLQVGLAGMLYETGAVAESRSLLDTVLAEDRDTVGALKLRARIALDEDEPEQAVQDLRSALAQAPHDPETLTILALAYERQGARELAGEQLARAVEVSGRGVQESLRYGDFLLQDNRTGPAESVVTDALRLAPEDPDLLALLGRIHLARHDWPRVDQVAALLRATGDREAVAQAADLEAASLAGQGRTGETLALLAERAADGTDPNALAALVRGRLAEGDPGGAQRDLEAVLAKDPGNTAARLLAAEVAASVGDDAEAEAFYKAVTTETPAVAGAWRAYAAFLGATGRLDEAAATLDAGLAANPGDADLLFAQASLREAQGDIAGAIAVYETLYARDTAAPLVANNLASLLATSGGDPARLDRAFGIARRLRGSDVPPFQDTYGWILFLRGDAAQALDYLTPAAEAMPENAQVQFHRAEAEFALGRWAEAGASYGRARDAAAAGSPLPEAAGIEERMAVIAARTAAPEGDPAAPEQGG